MNTRDDLGYTKPSSLPQQPTRRGPSKASKPAKPITPAISPLKRLEIKRWAEEKAYERAKELGKIRSSTDYEEIRKFDAFITNEALHWEKLAYLKIQNREALK